MRLGLWIVLAVVSTLTSQSEEFRLFGTNLYRLPSKLPSQGSRLYVEGTMLSMSSNALVIDAIVEKQSFLEAGDYPLDGFDYHGPRHADSDFTHAMRLARQNQTPLTASELSQLKPNLRRHVRVVRAAARGVILNYPGQFVLGRTFREIAIPVPGTRIPTWDFGRRVKPTDTINYPSVITMDSEGTVDLISQENGVEAVPSQAQSPPGQVEDQKAVFARRCSQATNGNVYVQYLLGLDYLSGSGTTTNREAGLYWLRRATAKGSPEARKALAEHSTE